MTRILVTAHAFGSLAATHVQESTKTLMQARKRRTQIIKNFKRQGHVFGEYLLTSNLANDSRGCAVTAETRGAGKSKTEMLSI